MGEGSGMTHRVDGDGILRIVFDRPNESVNLLDERVLRELDRLLEEARRREEIRGLMFQSAKPGVFVAGMDVEQIAAVTDAYRGAEGARFAAREWTSLARPTQARQSPRSSGSGMRVVERSTQLIEWKLAIPRRKFRGS